MVSFDSNPSLKASKKGNRRETLAMSELKEPDTPFFSGWMAAGYPAVTRPVPVTTPTRYLSGYITLNVPSPFTGDTRGATTAPDCLYCFPDQPEPFPLWGEGCEPERNTLHIYGDYGIHDYTEILYTAGIEFDHKVVYGADHFRAILDVVHMEFSIRKPDHRITKHGFATTWIVAECIVDIPRSMKLLKMIESMEKFMPDNKKWMVKEWIKAEEIRIISGAF